MRLSMIGKKGMKTAIRFSWSALSIVSMLAVLGGCDKNQSASTINASTTSDGTPTPMTDLAKFPAAMRPSWNNRGESEGMSPCVFLSGAEWKAWDGRLAVGFLRGKRIEILQLDKAGMTTGTSTISGLPSERIRTLAQGPDGALYLSTDGGDIWRLAPTP